MSGTVSKPGQKFMTEKIIDPIGSTIAIVLLSKCDVFLIFFLNIYMYSHSSQLLPATNDRGRKLYFVMNDLPKRLKPLVKLWRTSDN